MGTMRVVLSRRRVAASFHLDTGQMQCHLVVVSDGMQRLGRLQNNKRLIMRACTLPRNGGPEDS
jgi:hypothetical protein